LHTFVFKIGQSGQKGGSAYSMALIIRVYPEHTDTTLFHATTCICPAFRSCPAIANRFISFVDESYIRWRAMAPGYGVDYILGGIRVIFPGISEAAVLKSGKVILIPGLKVAIRVITFNDVWQANVGQRQSQLQIATGTPEPQPGQRSLDDFVVLPYIIYTEYFRLQFFCVFGGVIQEISG